MKLTNWFKGRKPMGGLNEKDLTPPAAPSKVKKVSPMTQIGNLRMHENKGEVHIHDDANRKKVAVDANQFHTAWNKFRTAMIHDERMMVVGKDGLHAAVFIAQIDDSGPDVSVSIVEVAQHTNLAKIEAFIAGK